MLGGISIGIIIPKYQFYVRRRDLDQKSRLSRIKIFRDFDSLTILPVRSLIPMHPNSTLNHTVMIFYSENTTNASTNVFSPTQTNILETQILNYTYKNLSQIIE